jgi:hypothetical protein
MAIRIRQQLLKDPELAEQFRDVQRAFDSIPTMLIRKFELEYQEPLVIGNLTNEPDGIELIRIIDLGAPESPLVGVGGLCHWVWRPDRSGAQVMSIGGMSLPFHGGVRYRFTFRITYVPVGGFSV